MVLFFEGRFRNRVADLQMFVYGLFVGDSSLCCGYLESFKIFPSSSWFPICLPSVRQISGQWEMLLWGQPEGVTQDTTERNDSLVAKALVWE